MPIRNVINQDPFKSPHLDCESSRKQKKKKTHTLIKAQWSYRCAVWEGFGARRMAVSDRGRPFLRKTPPWRKNNRFLFLFLYPLITKLMYCHTWFMGSVAYRGPWSICEHFNSNMENCMSKYQRVMPWVPAFSAEGRLFLLGSYLPETLPYSDKITFTHYLQHIRLVRSFRSHSNITFVLFLYARFTSHKYKCMIIFIWIESLPAQSLAYWLLMLRGRGEINRGCTESRQIK